MTPTLIQFDNQGRSTNMPDRDKLVVVYGMDGLDAEGPALASWGGEEEWWLDEQGCSLGWQPLYYVELPENPCKSIAAPTVGNEVV